MCTPETSQSPSNAAAIAIVRGELSSKRRWAYRILFVMVTVVFAGILSLWITEPRPLPLRLHGTFAAMLVIAVGWIGVLSWILLRRNCPTAQDQIATSWMALIGCTAMFIVAATIAGPRGSMMTTLGIITLGVPVVGTAGMMVRAAYRRRADLRRKLHDLEDAADASRRGSGAKIVSTIVFCILTFPLSDSERCSAKAESTCEIDSKSTQILAAHTEASGGRERLAKLKSRRIIGELVKHGIGIRTEILHAAPNQSLTKTFFPRPGTLIQGYDGVEAWVLHPTRGSLSITSDQQQAIQDESWFDRVGSVDEVFTKIRYERFDPTANKEILVLLNKNATASKWHFDRTSKLLSLIERKVALGPRGTATVRVHFEDYRETDGVMLPWKIRTVTPRDETALVVKQIEFNVKVADEIFEMER